MSEQFAIRTVSIIYGSACHSAAFLEKWLRKIPISTQTERLLAKSTGQTRRATFVNAVWDVGGFDAQLPTFSWEQFRSQPFGTYDEAVIIAVEDSKTLQAAVAIHVHRTLGPVTVQLGAHEGQRTITVPETRIGAMFRLAVSFLCVRHGVVPGTSDPQLWWEKERSLRVGRWSVVAHGEPTPVPFFRPLISSFTANSREQLRVAVEQNHEGGTGPYRAVVVADSWDIQAKRTEVLDLMDTGRSFSDGIWISGPNKEFDGVCLAPGPYELSMTAGGALAACHPVWRSTYPKVLRESGDAVSREARIVALGRWFCVQMRHVVEQMTVPMSVLSEGVAASYFQREDNEVEHSDLWSELLAGDFASLREWLAEHEDVAGATAEQMMWQSWLILGPLEIVEAALEGQTRVFQTLIRTSHECVISGPPEALDEVLLLLLDSPRVMASELDFAAVVHCPPAASAKDYWNTEMCAIDSVYDLRPSIEAAFEEGRRLFIDIGPNGQFANWVDRILEGNEHTCVSTSRTGTWGPRQLFNALGLLSAIGVNPNTLALDGMGVPAPDLAWQQLPKPKVVDEVIQEIASINTRLLVAHNLKVDALGRSIQRLHRSHDEVTSALAKSLRLRMAQAPRDDAQKE